MKRRVVIAGLLSVVAASMAAAELPTVRIGVVVDGPWALNSTVRQLTIDEVTALTEGEFDVRFGDSDYLVGDWSHDTARANVERLLDDPEVDLVIAWGILASHTACCFGDLAKPVIAPVILDPALQGLPLVDGASGVHNLNYVALPDNLAQEVQNFLEIVPFRHVAILTQASLLEAIPELEERTRIGLAGTGIDFDYVAAGVSADELLASLPPDIDAVYAWPLFQFSAAEYRKLIDGFIARGLPSFSGLGGTDVEQGMLATAGSPEFFPKLVRRVALNLQRILLGENAGEIPVEFTLHDRLVINMATARAIDVSPRWETLIEAEVLHPENLEGAYRLTLDAVVKQALELNLDLIVERRSVTASAEEVALARANLRPQLELSSTYLTIDDDRATAAFGNQPERASTLSSTLSQLLFSEGANANIAVQRSLQERREHEYESLRLDLMLEAATTYLNLMRAKTLERVQRNNVEQTRSNLEVSQIRREIGVAAAGEVLRWESEIASARKALIDAVADRRSAEIAINRLLHHDLESVFIAEEIDMNASDLLAGAELFAEYAGTPAGYRTFAQFVVREGLSRSPDLAAIDAAIAAQYRFELSTRRAFWAPTVSLQATLEELLSKGGAGSQPTAADDSSWSFALAGSLPLFSGGSRAAERAQAAIELERLQLLRSSTEEKIEQAIRVALEQARASRLGIDLSNRGAEAAGRNLELVEDAYARGVASLLDLLDAQTASLNAEELAANALYDCLIDLLEARRSASALDLVHDEEEREAFVTRLEAYLQSESARPRAGGRLQP